MIKINRGAAPLTIKVFSTKSVKALDGVSKITKAELELAKATAFFTDPANFSNNQKVTEKTFTFSVYKDAELVEALERAFGNKCAYCESDFAHVTPKDIEHFRPKSEIETGSGKLQPGYFWLAGEWNNLLVSCPDCNRGRKHEVPGQPAKIKLGKTTQFPLSNEDLRCRSEGTLANEETVRLLLDPCSDEPEEHLFFDDEGLIRARPDAQGQPDAKGTASIMVYALQRKRLVEARLTVLNNLKFCIDQLGFLAKNHNTLKHLNATTEALEANANQLRKVRDQLKNMLVRSAPFQAMLRQWIRKGDAQGDFDNLEQFEIKLIDLI